MKMRIRIRPARVRFFFVLILMYFFTWLVNNDFIILHLKCHQQVILKSVHYCPIGFGSATRVLMITLGKVQGWRSTRTSWSRQRWGRTVPPSCQGQGLPAEQKCECENWTQYNGHPEITVCWTNDKINRYNNVAYNCMFKKNLILYNDLLFRNG